MKQLGWLIHLKIANVLLGKSNLNETQSETSVIPFARLLLAKNTAQKATAWLLKRNITTKLWPTP